MRKQCSAAVLAGCSDRRTTVTGFRLDLTLRRDDEAHIAVEGPVGGVETRRIATLLLALLAAGARQLIVDLGHVESCDPTLTALLERQRRHLTAAGGWMIVDGAPARPGADTSSLMEILDINRHVRRRSDPHEPAAIDQHVGAAVSG